MIILADPKRAYALQDRLFLVNNKSIDMNDKKKLPSLRFLGRRASLMLSCITQVI